MPNDALTPNAPLLFTPGLLCDADLFSAQLAEFEGRGRTQVADHARGETIADCAAAILAAAPPRFGLVGLSMGGYLAFEIWRQAPERVLGLFLMATSARADAPERIEIRERAVALAEAGKFHLAVAASIPNFVAPDAFPALKSRLEAMALRTGPDAYIRQQRAIISRPDSRPDLPRLDVPTVMLVGDRDQVTPPPLAEEIAAAVPDCELVTAPGVGHLPSIEAPDLVNAQLLVWSRRLQEH